MVQLSELTKDKSFRTRLILACLAVSIFVSIIYVVVSYRLTAELGMNTQMDTLELEARLLHRELLDHTSHYTARPDSLAKAMTLETEVDTKVFIRAFSSDYRWQYIENLSEDNADTILSAIALEDDKSRGSLNIGEQNFLWLRYQGSQFTIELVQSSDALDTTMKMVGKRLSLVSIIVLWVALWLALTLSSFIAKRVQQKNDALANIATHDNLTGLPNRLYLDDLLANIMDRATGDKRQEAVSGCLFVIDLDKFKEVNDSFGHAAGDKLLIEIATRFRAKLQEDQVLVRVGGDEFIIWTPNIGIEQAKLLAAQLVATCEDPVMLDNLAVNAGASIGIAHYPTHADSGETLHIHADTAMYKAKAQHCGWLLFDEGDTVDARDRLRLRADLSHALEREEIKLHYQPKISLSSGKIIGVEALSRWHHPQDGVLSPFVFIDLIEHSGKVQEFGRYVIKQSIKQLATWQNMGINTPIAINLSPYNLLDPGLVAFTSEQLKAFGVPANRLEVELTENETSLNIANIRQPLESLKALGVVLALDDFGTGMSSLSYVANLNVNIIKIDRAFVSDMHTNDKHLAIVSAAITLSQSLGCKVVAEGIELEEHANMLLKMGCDYGQGYLFSKPISSDAMTDMLKG